MASAVRSSLPWEVTSEQGTPGMPVDVKFQRYPMYGGFAENMRSAYPNYPTAFMNLNGFPYEDIALYGGFLEGFVGPDDRG